MNEMQFGDKVRHILNRGLDPDAAVAERLRAARERALAHQRTEPAAALRWADNVQGRFGGWGSLMLRVLLPAALLVGGLAAIYTWQQNRQLEELEEIDAQLLAGVLPIDTYLDPAFQTWLETARAAQR